jgi:hypothetical protein
MTGPDLGDQECAIALAGDHTGDQSLGATVTVYLRGVDYCHAKREPGAQRFFLGGFRMSSLDRQDQMGKDRYGRESAEAAGDR